MTPPPDHDPKRDALARHGVLHPHPERVRDELFEQDPFFDPYDLVQVKYEMLRRARVDGRSVSDAAAAAGLSRPTFYSAKAAFEREGLLGLLPAKKGPKRAHKLADEVLDVVETWLDEEPDLGAPLIAARLLERRELEVHPRSIERALARRRRKGGIVIPVSAADATVEPLAAHYERLRHEVLTSTGDSGIPGLASVLWQGLWAWARLARAPDALSDRRRPPPWPPCQCTAPPAQQAELVDVWVDLVLSPAAPVEAR